MNLKIGVYNVEWMRDLFDDIGNPITTGEEDKRSKQLAKVINQLNVDFLGIVEGPDTLADGSKTASGQLDKWITQYGLDSKYKGIHGTPSRGQQELCAIYDSTKINVRSTPTTGDKNDFKQEFYIHTTNELIKEQYKHFRPPLELTVETLDGKELTKVIVAHTKSKGIFSVVDYARFEQISERDRMRLYAECASIRLKCDRYINEGSQVIVMGDINDGVGMDFYENRFSKSAVDILLGNVWEPEKIMFSCLEKPKWGRYGWTPSSSRYTDRITEDEINVLIDHIIISGGIKTSNGLVWNPREQKENSSIQTIKDELYQGADHFPITTDIELKPIN